MIKIAFGKACREYREKMNISQEKFALLIEHITHLSNLEKEIFQFKI